MILRLETVVTPSMLDAGLEALAAFVAREVRPEQVVEEVYLAMVRAALDRGLGAGGCLRTMVREEVQAALQQGASTGQSEPLSTGGAA